tara:strand:- start:17 stop:547 length:531 start_codon:yes stop_codon:yes gene_type:complete
MGLVQVNTATITSDTADVQLDGINTDDVYVVFASGVTISVNTAYLQLRVTKDVSGTTTTQTTSNYDYAAKTLKANTSFSNFSNTNRTRKYVAAAEPISNDVAGENENFIFHLYNFNNSSEYSFVTCEEMIIGSTSTNLQGDMGGFVYTVAETHNGFSISGNACSISGGTFTLYKVV